MIKIRRFTSLALALMCLAGNVFTSFAQQVASTTASGTSSPDVTPPPLVPFDIRGVKKERVHIYLLMGQSNMVGRDTSTIGNQVINPSIGFLDPQNRLMVAREPMHAGGNGMGPGISFAREMLVGKPDIKILLVPCAVGGSPLSCWVKEGNPNVKAGGDLYAKAVARAREAMKFGVLKGVLWHQGESDSFQPSDAEPYEERLKAMFSDLRKDLGNPDLPIVVGQLGEFFTGTTPLRLTVKAAIQKMPTDLAHVGIADSQGLGDKGDRLHFSSTAQEEFGRRYAAVMNSLQTAGLNNN